MKKTPIDPCLASMAATFYEPVYQRLRQWHQGRTVDLLCFVQATNEATRQVLNECGAVPSRTFRAGCFQEIWEATAPYGGRFRDLPASLDQAISQTVGCQTGKYPATAGFLQWGDHEQAEQLRRHVPSQLLLAAQAKRGRTR
ncbi:MAG TPA: hypothetical protein VGN12_27965 [Pirellulales bacterium]